MNLHDQNDLNTSVEQHMQAWYQANYPNGYRNADFTWANGTVSYGRTVYACANWWKEAIPNDVTHPFDDTAGRSQVQCSADSPMVCYGHRR